MQKTDVSRSLFVRLLKYLFYVTFFFLVMGQLTSLSRDLSAGGSNLYLFDISLAVFVVLGVFVFLNIKSFRIPNNFMLFTLFTVSAFLSLLPDIFILSSANLFTAFLYFLRWLLYLSGGLVIYNMFDKDFLRINDIINMIMAGGFLFCVIGFIQLVILPDFTKLDPAFGWDPHKNRLASTFFDPNFAGAFINICLSIGLWKAFVSKDKLSVGGVLMYVVVPFIALVLTFSRSSWMMFSVIVLVYGIFKSKKLILLVVLGLFLTYFAVPRIQTRISGATDPADSAHFRLISWQNTWSIARDNMFLGVGFNAFRFYQQKYGYFKIGSLGGNSGSGSDSSFLLVLATTGGIGFVIFWLAYMHQIIISLQKRLYEKFESGSLESFRFVVLSIFVGLFFHSQFVNSFFYPQILFLLMTIMAISSRIIY